MSGLTCAFDRFMSFWRPYVGTYLLPPFPLKKKIGGIFYLLWTFSRLPTGISLPVPLHPSTFFSSLFQQP
jgi:hypothetical protein